MRTYHKVAHLTHDLGPPLLLKQYQIRGQKVASLSFRAALAVIRLLESPRSGWSMPVGLNGCPVTRPQLSHGLLWQRAGATLANRESKVGWESPR